jgi:uncharacterized protein with HEPN domain
MRNDDRIRLRHIIEEAQEAHDFVKDFSFEDFVKDGKTVRAVIRSIEVIGEASAKISDEFKSTHKNVPWDKIIGMCNRLIHVYFDIDYDIVWQTVQKKYTGTYRDY